MTDHPRWLRKRRAPVLLLGGAVLLLHALVLLSGRSYAGHDFQGTMQPHVEAFRRGLGTEGALPFWNFQEFAGTPFLGNLVDEVFYPPNALFALLPALRALEWLVVLHLGLAAFGTYRLARSYRLGREAATIAACAYALSFTLLSRTAAGHYAMLVTFSQASLVLLFIRRTILDPTPSRAVLLSIVSALAVVGGHAPFVYQLILLAAAFAGFELYCIRQDRPRMLRAAGLLAGAGTAAALLSAVHLLPALEVRRFATRADLSARELYAHQPPDFSFLPRDFSTFWIPLYPRATFIQGDAMEYYWHEKAVYIGLLPLALACLGAAAGRRNGIVRFLVAAALLALADGLSRHLPLHRLLMAVLPGYESFRVPARSVWIAAWALCLLAGYGWDARRRLEDRLRIRVGIPVAFAGTGLLVAIVLVWRFGAHSELGLYLATLTAAAAVLAVSLLPGRHVAAVAVLLVTVELGAQGRAIQPMSRPEALGPRPWYLDALGPDPGEYRILDLSAHTPGSTPMCHGVRLMDGRGYPMLRATSRLYASAFGGALAPSFDRLGAGERVLNARPLDLLNVGWIVGEGPLLEAGLVEVARHGDSVLYRRPTSRPYAWRGAEGVETERGVDRIRLRVRPAPAGTLVVSESWMPGWIASVDGRPTPVAAYEGTLLSLELPEGGHDVEFRYRPTPYRTGSGVTLISLTALAGLLLFQKFSGRTPNR